MRGEEAATPENRSAPISTAPELSLSQTMSFQVRPIRTGDPGRTLHSRFQFAGLETNPANPCQSDRKQLLPVNGGARRIRTDDILLAKQALYQLSYGPSHPLDKNKAAREGTCRCRCLVARATVKAVNALPGSMVGPGRLELPTLRLSGVRSNHLSYRPSCDALYQPRLAIRSMT